MTDEPFYKPGHRPAPAPPRQLGELLFEFLRGHERFRVELRDDGAYGVDVRFFKNEEFLYSRRLPNRELAIRWAELERDEVIKDGAE